MQYGRGTGAPVLVGNLQLGYGYSGSPLCTYRDSIRRVSGGGLCRSALPLFTRSSDTEAGDGSYRWSSASSASVSSSSLDAWGRCSPSSSSSFSSDWEAAGPDGVDQEELRAIALQMVHDGYMQGLIRAFGAGRSSSSSAASASARRRPGLEESLLESWFSELHLEDGGCASLLDLMERWIKALKTMVQVLCITQQELRAKRPPAVVGGVRITKSIWHLMLLLATGGKIATAEREQEEVAAHFVRFAEASVLRMLDFVDAVADAARNDNDDDQAPGTTTMLPGMLLVYTCVADDWPAVLALFDEEAAMTSSVNSVFLRKMSRLSDAIWGMMEKARASFVTVTDDDCRRVVVSSPAEAAGGVHETTRLVMSYVMLLSRNERAVHLILRDQQHRLSHHQPDSYHSRSSVDILIMDMISCLEKQLEKTSNFIPDAGLRYMFLMNNCSFISQKVSALLLPSSRTLDASWEPVMSCLYHDVPRGVLKLIGGGSLDKFETEFDETYKKQKQWKVPNPELRKRLRRTVIQKVIPAYREYMIERTAKGKSNRPPKNTPLELEELLKELFEG